MKILTQDRGVLQMIIVTRKIKKSSLANRKREKKERVVSRVSEKIQQNEQESRE